MSLQSYFDYQCAQCGEAYLPFRADLVCPRCQAAPEGPQVQEIVTHFVNDAVEIAWWHRTRSGGWLPSSWRLASLGDHYTMIVCTALHHADLGPGADLDAESERLGKTLQLGIKPWQRPQIVALLQEVLPRVRHRLSAKETTADS